MQQALGRQTFHLFDTCIPARVINERKGKGIHKTALGKKTHPVVTLAVTLSLRSNSSEEVPFWRSTGLDIVLETGSSGVEELWRLEVKSS